MCTSYTLTNGLKLLITGIKHDEMRPSLKYWLLIAAKKLKWVVRSECRRGLIDLSNRNVTFQQAFLTMRLGTLGSLRTQPARFRLVSCYEAPHHSCDSISNRFHWAVKSREAAKYLQFSPASGGFHLKAATHTHSGLYLPEFRQIRLENSHKRHSEWFSPEQVFGFRVRERKKKRKKKERKKE